MKRNGESKKKISVRHISSAKKKKPRPPEILSSIKSTNKLSHHNSSSRSSHRGVSIIKLKDISLTPGLPKPPGRLHISSAKKEKESSGSSLSKNDNQMKVIHEVINNENQKEAPKLSEPFMHKRISSGGPQHPRSISE